MSEKPFTQYLVDQLGEIERNWKLEPARFDQFRSAVQREIESAESLIAGAGHPAELLNDPEQGEALQRLLSALDRAERILTNARDAYTLRTGEAYRKRQKESGQVGAEKRFPRSDSGVGRAEALNRIIKRLLRNRPKESASELFDEFCSDCHADGIEPPGKKRFLNLVSENRKAVSR